MNGTPCHFFSYEKPVATFLILALLTGCLAAGQRVPASHIPTVKRVLVIPIEPPPLILPSALLWSWTGSEEGAEVEVVGGSVPASEGVAVLVVVAGVLLLVKTLVDRPKNVQLRKRAVESLDLWMSSDTSWVPTRVLAQAVADELSAGTDWAVVIDTQPRRLDSIKRREMTLLMENWYRPLRGWYNNESPSVGRSELDDGDFDAVIEVGMVNYEIFDDRLVMQVLLKWFDGQTGGLKGRSRHHAMPLLASPEEMFGRQGERFKSLFGDTGRVLVRDCLTELGAL